MAGTLSGQNPDRRVSSEAEELILVDREDRVTGFLSKADCHDGDGVLHRAFSVFLFDTEGRLLIQQRAAGKRLWPGYWSNSCCSHPRRGEALDVAAARRLNDELNVRAELEFVYRFIYRARYGAQGSEHELCHVFLGRLSAEPHAPDLLYAGDRPAELDEQLNAAPETFTPWFRLEWQTLKERHATPLSAYAAGTRCRKRERRSGSTRYRDR